MALTHVHVVLSRPSEPRNVGAACRAIKNAGITRLTIVTDSEIDLKAARPLAVDARDVLEAARIVPDLRTALAGSTLIAGVTRRLGQRRKLVSYLPWQLAEKVVGLPSTSPSSNPVSIVFGNEQSGLTDSELQLCHIAVSIPSSPEFPSLNLSHAVQVIAYELYIADLANSTAGAEAQTANGRGAADSQGRTALGHQRIPTETIAENVARITESLEILGYQIQDGPQGMRTFLTDILGRAMLSEPEVLRLSSLFEKLVGMHCHGTTPDQSPGAAAPD
jgi:tRNA/rRNA methyltransferase